MTEQTESQLVKDITHIITEYNKLEGMLKNYRTDKSVRDAVAVCMKDRNLKYLVEKNLPYAVYQHFNVNNRNNVPIYQVDMLKTTDHHGFFDTVNDFNYLKKDLKESQQMFQWIKDNYHCHSGSKIKEGPSICVIMFIVKQMMRYKNKPIQDLDTDFPQWDSLLNHCLQTMGTDGISIVFDDKLKMCGLIIEQLGFQSRVWVRVQGV